MNSHSSLFCFPEVMFEEIKEDLKHSGYVRISFLKVLFICIGVIWIMLVMALKIASCSSRLFLQMIQSSHLIFLYIRACSFTTCIEGESGPIFQPLLTMTKCSPTLKRHSLFCPLQHQFFQQMLMSLHFIPNTKHATHL